MIDLDGIHPGSAPEVRLEGITAKDLREFVSALDGRGPLPVDAWLLPAVKAWGAIRKAAES